MSRRIASRAVWVGLGILVMGLAACSRQEQPATPQVEGKSFTLTPAAASVRASFLTGELQEMKVEEQVEGGTGKIVDPPKLRATLKLKNTSADQTARLIGGKIEYVDAEGKLIPLAEGRRDTSFQFNSYQRERLDPGTELTQNIEVPFPAAALKGKKLRDLRLELSYIPAPYKEDTVTIRVTLGQ